MRFTALSRILLTALVVIPLRAHASLDFSCDATACVIPYDSEGVQNGTEVCYGNEDKKEKRREVTWKNGLRDGTARCFSNGKVTKEATYVRNVLDGPFIEKKYDSNGDRVALMQKGRLLGFVFHLGESGKISKLGECWKDESVDESATTECLRADYGPYDKLLRAELAAAKAKNAEAAALAKAKLNGPQTEKYGDGKVRAQYTTNNGKIVGVAKFFHKNGKLRTEESYSTAGLKNGSSKAFDEDGKLTSQRSFQDDELVAETRFYQNGNPMVTEARSGKSPNTVVCSTNFYDTGEKYSYECKKSGDQWWGQNDGVYNIWAKNGKLIVRGQYKNGKRAAKWSYYDDNGDKVVSESSYDDRGNLIKETLYRSGKRIEREYFPDGSIKKESSTVDAAT